MPPLPKPFQFPSASSKLTPNEEAENLFWTILHFAVVLSTGGRHDKNEDGDTLSWEEHVSQEFNYADEVIRKMQSRDHYRRAVRIMIKTLKD